MRFLRELPIPGILFAGILWAIRGGGPANAMSAANEWLLFNVQYPFAFTFFIGLLLAYSIIRVGIYWFHTRFQNKRIAVANLRIPGTQLRTKGMGLKNQTELDAWWVQAEEWNNLVVYVIAQIDKADSIRFATLGYPGQVRDFGNVAFFLHLISIFTRCMTAENNCSKNS